MRAWKKRIGFLAEGICILFAQLALPSNCQNVSAGNDEIVLRICNCEEYIDLGDWDEEELIELENGQSILGINPMYEDFEDWYYEQYGKKVRVEYSCFGTNEELYNQLTIGDVYDLICPSDYMLMKLEAENKLVHFSEEFFDAENENNYYIRNISPYIKDIFEQNEIGSEKWITFAGAYMWGTTGILYNPEYMSEEDASTWDVFKNPDYYRRITLKDSVRDAYFAALGSYKGKELLSEELRQSDTYQEELAAIMNDVKPETIHEIEGQMQDIIRNIYSLETDSGKADIVTGKVVANYQYSGDAVYAMDQAEEDEVYLKYASPKECVNVWFDGWAMLKAGIGDDAEKQHVAESFINFVSRPDNVVRNMYYIGYTSAISGNEEDTTIFDFLKWKYETDEEEDTVAYPLGYFFAGDNADQNYIVNTSADQVGRQLYAQYPSEEIISRGAIMGYFNEEEMHDLNQMWINARCYQLKQTPVGVWVLIAVVAMILLIIGIRKHNEKRMAYM